MTTYRLGWLFLTLAWGVVSITSCGDHDDTTGGGGKAGSGGGGGSTVTGGSGGVGGVGGTSGPQDGGGGKDAAADARVPCGATTCNPNGTNRYCNPAGPNGPRCQACLADEHCAGNMQNPPRLYCDSAAGSCRSCLNDSHCAPPNRCIMGNSNNTCQLRCSSDADCANATGNRRACNLTTMMCVECQDNTHCVGNSGGPICVDDNCEDCGVDTDCITPGLPACINNNCEGCRDSTQCAEPTPICVTTGTNTCRECGGNADCASRPGGPACVMSICRHCSGSVPCPAGNTCVMNNCVPVPEAGSPEAGSPEAGRDGSGGDASTEGGSSGEAGQPDVAGPDGAGTAEGGSSGEGGQPEGGGTDVALDTDGE
jgi:hypothetical protein